MTDVTLRLSQRIAQQLKTYLTRTLESDALTATDQETLQWLDYYLDEANNTNKLRERIAAVTSNRCEHNTHRDLCPACSPLA